MITRKPSAPVVYKGRLRATKTSTITNGRGRMPAFNYGLEPSEISAIESLKTAAEAPEGKQRCGEAGLETAGSTANG